MKSVLIIGMGKFGHQLCESLLEFDNQVMIVDVDETKVEDLMSKVTTALVADCRKENVLENIGVSEFDICFVCIGDTFQSNLEITSLLKELGAKKVVSLSRTDMHTKFLLRNGADDIIYPDRDAAIRASVKFSKDNLYDYIELEKGYSIFEISPPSEWVGKTLVESNIRKRYSISVIGIKNTDNSLNIAPDAEYVIAASDHLMVIGRTEDINKVIK